MNDEIVISKSKINKWIELLKDSKKNIKNVNYADDFSSEVLAEIRICCGMVQEDLEDLLR